MADALPKVSVILYEDEESCPTLDALRGAAPSGNIARVTVDGVTWVRQDLVDILIQRAINAAKKGNSS